MANIYSSNLSMELPFHGSFPFQISQMFQSNKDLFIEQLESNNFAKNMFNIVNEISKNNFTCNYHQENSINDLAKKHLPDCLKIFHLNIVSFNKKGRRLSAYLKCLNFKFNIICLTEIRENNIGIIEKEFPDFDIYLDNPQKSKGGVGLLIRKNIFKDIREYGSTSDLTLNNKCSCNKCQIENKWVSMKIKNQEIVIGGIYRHPNNDIATVNCFNSALENSLSQINKNSISIILGDINIDLLQEKDYVDTYITNFFKHNYIPAITVPTRITHHSATLIDHIFIKLPTKYIQNKCSSGNLYECLSDHLPNFTFIDISAPTINNRPFVRQFSVTQANLFTESLQSEAPLIEDRDLIEANNSYNIFSENYLRLFNKYFPFKQISRKQFKDKPYITAGLKISIRTKNKLYQKYLKNKSPENEASWKNFRNRLNTCIKRAEERYYSEILKSNQSNSTNLWKTFGKILNKKKIKHKRNYSLIFNNRTITDTQEIVEIFNNFFCEIGNNLASKFPSNNNSEYKKYLKDPALQTMYLYKTNVKEITETIKRLKNTHSSGHDEFSSKFIKLSTPLLAPALEKIFNLAIKTGTYPDMLKIAKVIPVFKKGCTTSINNYRPISILSSVNKIFEKILYTRLIKYIDKFQLLYKYQYGFRKKHSTEQSLIEFVDKIRFNIEEKSLTCGIFIDLSKAFDTVDHNILISKLEHYGIRGIALNLFKSYLTNRKQYVQLDNYKSQTKSITCGVPQGSVLGPLLFLLFINDLPNSTPIGNFRIFADDTNVFFHCENIHDIIPLGQTIMLGLNSWFKANKMTLNTDKTSFIIFKSKYLNIPNIPNEIEFLNTKITRAAQVKFLGITLDENLNWDTHINEICNRLKALFHVFYSIRDFLSKEDIKTIYYTLIYSRIKYGITIFGHDCKSKVKKLQTLQNQLLKVLSHKNYRFSTEQLHKEFKLMTVENITKHETLSFVHKFIYNCLPPVFKEYFKPLNHTHGTRNRDQTLEIKAHSSVIAANSVQIMGAKLWNSLSNEYKILTKTKCFRNELKEHLT